MEIPTETPYNRPRRRRFTFEERVLFVDRLVQKSKAFDCRLTRLLGNLNADFGLTRARLRILDCVIRFPGWNISRIAYELDLSRQTVHRTVHAMERVGLLDLEEGPDRRSIYPSLTGTGRVVAKLRLTQAHEWSHQLIEPIDTAAISAAEWLFGSLLRYLPERIDAEKIDPEALPLGLPKSFYEALRIQQRVPRKPIHPIIADGGDRVD